MMIVAAFFIALATGLTLWAKGGCIEEKRYDNVQQIRMYSPNEVTIFVKMVDGKITTVDFRAIRPVIIEDAPIDGPMRVEQKNCDIDGWSRCLEMHVHSLKDVEPWKRASIPLPDE